MRNRRTAVLLGLLLLGFAIRLPGLREAPLDFHPTRQYHDAALALKWAPAAGDPSPAALRARTALGARERPIEPTVLALATAAGWRLLDDVALWLPRLLSIAAWLVAVAGVHRLGRQLTGEMGAAVAAAVMILLPYGVAASRSIQPEPLMVAAIAWTLVATAAWAEQPTRRTFGLAAALAGAAVFVKVVAVFIVVPAFLAVALAATSRRRAWAAAAGFTALTIVPAVAWLAFGTAAGFIGPQTGGRLLPDLWRTSFFWRGWATNATFVFGAPLMALLAVGTIVAWPRPQGRVLAGAVAGYAVYGLSFTYHVATHDYYQLPLMPVVATAAGVAITELATVARRRGFDVVATAMPVVLVAMLALALVVSPRWVVPADTDATVAQARRLGELLDHSDDVVAIAPAYARPLAFHGDLVVSSWPSIYDDRLVRLRGADVPTAADRLEDVRRKGTRWLVVTDMERWRTAERDLRPLVERSARLAHRADGYLVYDLSERP